MSYKTLLVHFADERRLPSLLKAASSIARSSGAHIIGLSVLPPIIIVPATEGGPEALIDQHRLTYRAQMDRMGAAFASATNQSGLSVEWRQLDCQEINPFGDVARVVMAHARSADLVIAGQANSEWAFSGYLDLAEHLIMGSGRPVLVIPKASPKSGQEHPIGRRILLAWNGSRESTRAAFDALPMLKAADQVDVVRIDPDDRAEGAGDVPGVDICTALARHGVKCQALQPVNAKRGVGSTLLAAADRQNADMLVMGCYGHSRLREWAFGGASQHVLNRMTVPVLMSH